MSDEKPKVIGVRFRDCESAEVSDCDFEADIGVDAERTKKINVVNTTTKAPTVYNVNVTNNDQRGGVSTGVLNVFQGRPQRQLTDDMRIALSANVPKTQPILVLGRMGDRECIAYARQIFDYLSGAGFPMAGPAPGEHAFNTQATDVNVDVNSRGFDQKPETKVVVESAR